MMLGWGRLGLLCGNVGEEGRTWESGFGEVIGRCVVKGDLGGVRVDVAVIEEKDIVFLVYYMLG